MVGTFCGACWWTKWLGDQKKPSHRERICTAIDDALAQKPDSFEALLEFLRQAGYEIKGKKIPSLLGGEQKKFIRMDTLGVGYTPEDLRAVIAGKRRIHRESAKRESPFQKRKAGICWWTFRQNYARARVPDMRAGRPCLTSSKWRRQLPICKRMSFWTMSLLQRTQRQHPPVFAKWVPLCIACRFLALVRTPSETMILNAQAAKPFEVFACKFYSGRIDNPR